MPPVLIGEAVARHGIDGDFVRDWPQSGQHPAAFDNDASVGFLHQRQRYVLAEGVRGVGRATALHIHQRVGQGNVVLAEKLVIVENVLLELRPSWAK